ncbi:solute carrier family 25 member 35-like [Onthophagus taurus]|uniref:solute carrier family 25 member 35-like n=1 Tax=Onthophagus taurus TaxID=166361 RepID=UPI0039BE120F
MDFIIAGLAAVGAGIFSNPLEVIKIRMQLQGELQARGEHPVHYRNVFHATYTIAKHDGLQALQAGLVPALWFQFILNTCRLGGYDYVIKKGYTKNERGETIFYKSVLAGGLAGNVGAFVASPFFLVKTHLQGQAAEQIAFGYQHHHAGMWSAFKKIFTEHGIQGLYRGSTSAIPRSFLGSTAQLTTFTYSKEISQKYKLLTNYPLLETFMASMISGLFLSVMITPFDLVCIRLYNQGVDSKGKGLLYNNFLDCFLKVSKSEGFWGFYKGIGPCYLRLGPHTVLSLVFWDILKDVHKNIDQKISLVHTN